MTSAKNDFTQGSILKKLAPLYASDPGCTRVAGCGNGAVDLLVVGEIRFQPPDFPRFRQGSQVLNLVYCCRDTSCYCKSRFSIIARYLGEKRPETIGSRDAVGGVNRFCGTFPLFYFS